MPHDLLRPPSGRRTSASKTDRGYDDDADSIEWARRLSERQLAPYRAASDAPTTATTAAPTTAQTYAHKASDNATQDALLASINGVVVSMREAGAILQQNATNVRPGVEVVTSLAETAINEYRWIEHELDIVLGLVATADHDKARHPHLASELTVLESAFAGFAVACDTGVAHGLPTPIATLQKKMNAIYAAFGMPRTPAAAGAAPPLVSDDDFKKRYDASGFAVARSVAAALVAARSVRGGNPADLDRLKAHLGAVVAFESGMHPKDLGVYVDAAALTESIDALRGSDKALEASARAVLAKVTKK